MAVATGTAILGAAALGGASSIIGGNKASKAQQQGADQANKESARQYDQTRQDQLNLLTQQRADQAPWLEAGRNALTQLTQPLDTAALQSDPGYQFRMQQGTQAIERSAAARGGLLSGAAAKALTRYSQGVASDEYGNRWNRLASLAGVGQAASNQIGQAGQNAYGTIASAGQNSSNSIQNNLMGAANARASGYVNTANAINSSFGSAIGGMQQNQLLSMLNKGM